MKISFLMLLSILSVSCKTKSQISDSTLESNDKTVACLEKDQIVSFHQKIDYEDPGVRGLSLPEVSAGNATINCRLFGSGPELIENGNVKSKHVPETAKFKVTDCGVGSRRIPGTSSAISTTEISVKGGVSAKFTGSFSCYADYSNFRGDWQDSLSTDQLRLIFVDKTK